MSTTARPRKIGLFHREARQPDPARLYGERFYEDYQSLDSARIYLNFLWTFLQPVAVLDVGCGQGTWLKACHELGATRLLGFDGHWNSPQLMIDPDIDFTAIDLNQPFSVPEKVDIVITLEVAEHLNPATAPHFIKCLTEAADVVLFGAAYPKQGGVNHINEQPHTYWAELFDRYDFAPFDLFRAKFWGDNKICFWYRQNTFLYINRHSKPYEQMRASGVHEMPNLDFMNCVHPELFDLRTIPTSFTMHIRDLLPSLRRALRGRAR